MKLATVVKECEKPQEIMEVTEFNIHNMCWRQPSEAKFLLDDEPFAQGAFRCVHRATCNSGRQYVIKKLLPSTMEQVNEINVALKVKETGESLARKSVQMQMLALNFVEQFKLSLPPDNKSKFGETYSYTKAKLGRIISTGEFVMIEDFIQGDFCKYINNDGTISNELNDCVLKAECLAHFSYDKSVKQLMLLDIQGSGYLLYDPEIATATGAFSTNGSQLRFCMGNLANEACTNFIRNHTCNHFCKLAGLTDMAHST